MKEAQDQFVVQVIDEAVAVPAYDEALVKYVNSLQSQIVLTTESNKEVHFSLNIVDGAPMHPYLVKDSEAEISLSFYENSSITLPSTYYLAYFLAIALLEYLIQTRLDMALKVFPREFCPAANEYIWRGSIPVSSQATVDRLRGESPRTGQLVTAIEQVLRGTGRLYQKLTTKARMVADQLERPGLPTSDDVYRQIVSVFMYSDQERIADVANDIGSGHPSAVALLADLAADCPHEDAIKLLETLLKTKKLDEGDRDFIETALNKRRGAQPTPKLEPVSVAIGTGGIKVSISPSIIGNRPAPAITESKKPVDALNYRTYANAFGDLITNPKTGTPLTIGVCAPWGRGKTVLLGYIKDRIKEKSSNGTKCQCIDFNAWMYTKAEQLWAEFYSTILNGVEKSLSFPQKVWFKCYFFCRANPWSLLWWILSFVAVTAGYLLLFSYIEYVALILYSLPIAGVLWKYFRSLSKDIFSKSKRPKFRAALGVQHEIFKYFDIVRDWLVNIAPKRIVVFIDDIDRCSPDKIMQMLESIKLLLDTKNFVFVLAMDARVVRLAIGQHYKFMAETQAKREEMGRSYLEKIVQIPFALPQASPEDLVNMKNELFKGLLEVEDKKIDKAGEAKDSAPDGKITPPPEETTEDDKKGGAESVTRVEPVDRELEMHLTKEESETLDAILKERFELSPRLLIRLKNVYLIAKHLHQAATNEPPPPEFMHWIAYSVGFPFASKAVAEACEKHGWDEEWSQVFDDLRSRIKEKPYEYNFDPVELEELQTRLSGHISHPKEIERFIKHANCFNLVLD